MNFKLLILTLLISFFFQSIIAQTSTIEGKSVKGNTGIIKGTIIEESTGKPIPEVTIEIKGTKKITTSDTDGNFIIRDVIAGKYDIQFSAFLFIPKIVSEVEITNGDSSALTVSLVEKKNQLDEVVITTTKAKKESIKSLLTMQKNSIRVSDGISAETIKRTPDKTTSDVLKRISGSSVQDNKFVIIRGLNDRYNASFLNGGALPSSEPDRKAFSFDIFPANMIDNLVINKTASPDLTGEFAGGIIEINTKSIPDKDFQSFSFGSGYNTITTGKDKIYSKSGSTDWLGLENGSRSLPSSFPNIFEFQTLQDTKNQINVLQIDAQTKSINYDWTLRKTKFLPNSNFQYTIGKHFDLKEGKSFGFIVSLSNSLTNNYNQTTRKTYETPGVLLTDQTDDRYGEQVLSGAIANLAIKLNPNNTISFKNLYSITSNKRVIERNGDLTQESDPLQIQSTARLFTSNTIYTGQLIGEHFLPKSKLKINWVGSYAEVQRETPNDRANTYTYTKYDDGTVSQPTAYFQLNTVGGGSPGSMFSSLNNEKIYSGKVDFSKKFKFKDGYSVDVKAGCFGQSRSRNFGARQLGYIPFNGKVNGVTYGTNTFDPRIPTLNDANMFKYENLGILASGKSGLTLYDGTRPNDSYTASSKLSAAYLMFDNAFNKLRVVWGLRLEDYTQDLNSKLDNGTAVVINNAQIDYLPSINLIYSLTTKQNFRLSYSKTLNRPEFRELAPFLFYDADTRLNTEGTQDLKIATIKNLDFRYELFPGKNQLFSVSVFYKDFKDPIELQALANNSNKYRNSKSGENKGIELEYRTMLSSIFKSKEATILDDFTFFTNLAIIRSKVDLSNLVTTTGSAVIPLQGQSPYVFNAGVLYLNKEMGWSASANFNRIGDRVAFHGNLTDGSTSPSLWEKSRSFLDLQLSKSFLKNKLEIKVNAQNVLAQNLIFYENNDAVESKKIKGFNAIANSVFIGDSQNKNGFNKATDDQVWLTKYGRTFSFTMTYNF